MGVRNRYAALAAAQLILLGFCGSAHASAACPGDDLQPTPAAADTAATAVLCDLNQARAGNGLGLLRWDDGLASAAQAHAADMAARHYFSHISLDGRDFVARIQPTGYIPRDTAWTVAENIGFGTSTLSPPSSIIAGWMGSAPHRQNILDPRLEDVGIGIAQGSVTGDGQSGSIYVADFGARGPGVASAPVARSTSRVRRASRKCTRKVRRHGRRICRTRRR